MFRLPLLWIEISELSERLIEFPLGSLSQKPKLIGFLYHMNILYTCIYIRITQTAGRFCIRILLIEEPQNSSRILYVSFIYRASKRYYNRIELRIEANYSQIEKLYLFPHVKPQEQPSSKTNLDNTESTISSAKNVQNNPLFIQDPSFIFPYNWFIFNSQVLLYSFYKKNMAE